jgi:hypothetical protein
MSAQIHLEGFLGATDGGYSPCLPFLALSFLGASAGSWVPTQRPSADEGNITPHISERYNFTASHP